MIAIIKSNTAASASAFDNSSSSMREPISRTRAAIFAGIAAIG
jgi:hypothetical protein